MTLVVLALLMHISNSGRIATIAETPSQRLAPLPPIPPGPPPLVSFRYFEGKDRSRFGGLDLVLDDAGH
jgi:hypothetical protein